jgi:SRSO17 transposase
MDVHASPAVLPELEEFLASFPVRFRRPEGAHALERYLTGLRTELPNKNCDTMAQAVPGTRAQRLQACLTNRQWDHDDVNRQRVEQRIAAVTVGKGALSLDETGCAKQGTASVGVARQYAGTLGQVGNCQVAVPCCDSDARASWSVAVRWSLPTAWAEDPARLQRARVPEDVTFQTTPQRALALLLIKPGPGGCRIVVWWPMRTTATIPIFWRAWRLGANATWWPYAAILRCA